MTAGARASTVTPEQLAAFDALVAERLPAWTAELVEYLAIPSEGGDIEALRAAADWTADRLCRAGCDVEVLELGPDVPPLVVGEIGDGPRTITGVQHYDVQPAAPLELWTTPPYEPAIRDGRVWARGATDNKGEFLPRLWAVEAWRDSIGPLPCRVRYLVEGQEETGSNALDALLDLRPELRRADAALIEGGGIDMNGRAGIVGGGKGIVVFELRVTTLAHDAHSSLSVILPNAGHRLVAALATFWDADGRPAIEGLDVGTRPPTEAQLATIARQDPQELADVRADFGVERFLGGLDGFEAYRALTFQATLNLQGLEAGHTDATPKTVTPAEAWARIDIRIVPDQQPEDIVAAVRRHLDGHGFEDIRILQQEGEPAWWTPPDHAVMRAAAAVCDEVTGLETDIGVAMAGTVPMYQVCAEHRVPCVSLGAGRVDCRAHAPDENIRIEDLATATRMMGRFIDAIAALPEVPPVP
ncbi:MAG TPA: M20/M25/M40 family metallo-hydrolase [Candidatus Limnocylindrales bacterium]|nr:M20/M25/M40 family metallo-hydrolase [Candidatus Limnocylindrales bacterium]